jgi:hypothetical protein
MKTSMEPGDIKDEILEEMEVKIENSSEVCHWILPKSSLNVCCSQCESETFHYGSGSDFSMSSGSVSGSYFQKVSVSDPTFFLTKYDFIGPKMAFQNIVFKE